MLHKALAGVIASIPASSGGDEPGFMALGHDPRTGRDFVISNNEGIGWGATRDHDGANAQQHPSQSVVRNTPIEVLEHKSTIFHERLELIPDSGGAGKFRGGVGVLRQVRYLADGEVLSMKKKSKTRPWALDGGHEPEPSEMVLWPGTDRAKRVGMYRAAMKAGDRFINRTAAWGRLRQPARPRPGGGGRRCAGRLRHRRERRTAVRRDRQRAGRLAADPGPDRPRHRGLQAYERRVEDP